MFAIISSPLFWKEIEAVLSSKDEDITFSRVGTDISINEELEKIVRLPVKVLIFDISSVADQEGIKQAILSYKLKKENTRIIIIAPDCVPGNPVLSFLFSLGIWDILSPSKESLDLFRESLINCLNSSPSYSKGVKWFVDLENQLQPKKDITETVTKIEIRDKIIGTVTIAFAGVRPGVGCTFLALQAAFYCKCLFKEKKIAFVSLNGFSDVGAFCGDGSQEDGFFAFKGVHFYDSSCDVAMLINKRMYDYIVLDVGILKYRENNTLVLNKNYDEFVRSNVQFLVSGSAPWHIENLLDCLFTDRRTGDNNESVPWTVLINFASEDEFAKLSRTLERTCFAVPFFPYLFKFDESFSRFISEILKPVFPQKNIIKRKPKLFPFLKNL